MIFLDPSMLEVQVYVSWYTLISLVRSERYAFIWFPSIFV